MEIIIYLGALLAGLGLSLIWKPGDVRVRRIARFYLSLVLMLAFIYWIFYFTGIRKNPTVLKVGLETLKWLGALSHFVLGFLLGRLTSATLYLTLLGLSISVGNKFILSTVGKSLYLKQMIDFFHQSGYAVWFLYFIMAAETAGAIGILTHFRLRMGIPATIGLMLIMLGAVYTHWHNGDPFSDSYAAVCEFISLSLLLFLYSRSRQRPNTL
jgi:putative oxidoreductase